MLIRVNEYVLNVADITFAKFTEVTADQPARLVLVLRHMQGTPILLTDKLAVAVMATLCNRCEQQFGTDVSLIDTQMWPDDGPIRIS